MNRTESILLCLALLSSLFLSERGWKAGPGDWCMAGNTAVAPYAGRDSTVFRFMFYNVENLFDAIDDPDTDDEEFLPGGSRGWSHYRYYRKLQAIAKVLLSAGDDEPPALIGLCETENRAVAEDLIRLTPLKRYNYGLVYHESGDRRGIDVCLLYDSLRFQIVCSSQLIPAPASDVSEYRSRPVLYVEAVSADKSLHIFLNHWPSRRGGVLAGRPLRNRLAGLVAAAADSLRTSGGGRADIIVAGDFNCNPEDPEIAIMKSSGLINLTDRLLPERWGSYKYRGVWQYPDQILVSESMLLSGGMFHAGDISLHKPDFLLTDDNMYPGKKPFAGYEGYSYAGGFSDHLPLVLTVYY